MRKKFKTYLFQIVLILAISALTIASLFKTGRITDEHLRQLHLSSFVFILSVFFFSRALSAWINRKLFRPIISDWDFIDSFGDLTIGHLGSSITPLKSGHFPLRFYYHHRRGISFNRSFTCFSKAQILNGTSATLFYLLLFSFLSVHPICLTVSGKTFYLSFIILTGIVFHLLAIVFFLIVIFQPKLQDYFLRFVSCALFRLKKISNREEYESLQKKKMDICREQILDMFFHPTAYLPLIFLTVVNMILTGILPYICYLSITGDSFHIATMFHFYLLNISMNYLNNIIPVPGGSGTSEWLFSIVYSDMIPASGIGSVLLLWRFSTYFLVLVLDASFFFPFLFLAGRKRLKSQKNNSII